MEKAKILRAGFGTAHLQAEPLLPDKIHASGFLAPSYPVFCLNTLESPVHEWPTECGMREGPRESGDSENAQRSFHETVTSDRFDVVRFQHLAQMQTNSRDRES